MLSKTHSRKDLRTRMEADGIDLSNLPTAAVETSFEEAYLDDMYSIMNGQADLKSPAYYFTTTYDSIKAKDKTNLRDDETYIYWAEIYFAASKVIDKLNKLDLQYKQGSTNSESAEGYSESHSGVSGKSQIALDYYLKAVQYMSMAGYKVLQMGRSR